VSFPPNDAVQWIFWFTIPLAILAVIDSFLVPPTWPRFVVIILLWRLAMRAIIGRLVPSSISPQDEEFWIDAGSAIVLIWWLSLDALATQIKGITAPLLLSILCTGVGLFIFMTLHIQREGMLGISLGIISFATAVATWRNPKITLARGGAQTIVLLLMSLLTFAWFFTNDTLTPAQNWRAAALMAAPLLAFAGDLPAIARLRPSARFNLIRILIVGLIVAIVAGLSVKDYVQAERASAAAAGEI
jgi:hypothetical protein